MTNTLALVRHSIRNLTVNLEKARNRERIRRKRRLHVVRGRGWLASVRAVVDKRQRKWMKRDANPSTHC